MIKILFETPRGRISDAQPRKHKMLITETMSLKRMCDEKNCFHSRSIIGTAALRESIRAENALALAVDAGSIREIRQL